MLKLNAASVLLLIALTACADPGPTSGDENLSVVGNLEISAAMAPDSWDAEVTIRNTGPVGVTVEVVCDAPTLYVLDGPDGKQLWPPPEHTQCNLGAYTPQIAEGDSLVLTAHGPPTEWEDYSFVGGEYYVIAELTLDFDDPKAIDFPFGWVTFD